MANAGLVRKGHLDENVYVNKMTMLCSVMK